MKKLGRNFLIEDRQMLEGGNYFCKVLYEKTTKMYPLNEILLKTYYTLLNITLWLCVYKIHVRKLYIVIKLQLGYNNAIEH